MAQESVSRTKELIIKIQNAMHAGALPCSDIPIEDIKSCVRGELNVHENTFTAAQFQELGIRFNSFSSRITDGETDASKIDMFIDGMLICLETVSEAVCSLADRKYWSLIHASRLNDPEVAEIIDFVDRRHDVRLLPYDFVDNYMNTPCEVGYDPECGMHYVPYKNRRMYFPEFWDEERISSYFQALMAEQDPYSPHSYQKEGFNIPDNAVIADVGAAEGFFSMDQIDNAKHIYIMDADRDWISALQQTFKNDMDKVDIIFGYVGSESDGEENITLDETFSDIPIDYIKMDIEGYEKSALIGAKNLLSNNDITCAICTYHCREDEKWVTEYLNSLGYKTAHSRGYMCPDWTVESRLNAELRRGVVFGRK